MKALVVHLTTVHPRDDIRIFRKECVSLALAGYEVVQVVADGLGDAHVQGLRIVDIGPRPARRVARMRLLPQRALVAVRALRPALLHIHDPELLPIAVRLACQGMPVIYDAHEDVPRQILTKQWIARPLRGIISHAFERYENHQVQKLAAVVAATPHIAERFARVVRRSVNVNNFPFLDELAPPAAPMPRERAVCYVGGITRTRGALNMVRAVALLPGVRLLMAGNFEDSALEAELKREPGWAQVDYLGHIGRDAVRAVLARASAGLVTLWHMPSYVDSLPIKMFEYMSAQLPVVASDFPLWRGIVEDNHCGVCVDPNHPQAIAAAIRSLLADTAQVAAMGQAGRAAVLSRYNWPQAEKQLLALYRELLP
jgi:glycosyltransferase involved in cell wall biosynthesis